MASLNQLYDSFPGSLDPRWTFTGNATLTTGAGSTAGPGALTMTTAASTTATTTLMTSNTWDFTGAGIYLNATLPTTVVNGSATWSLRVTSDTQSTGYFLNVAAGQIRVTHTEATSTDTAVTTYPTATTSWFRLRHDAADGKVYASTSTDGKTWATDTDVTGGLANGTWLTTSRAAIYGTNGGAAVANAFTIRAVNGGFPPFATTTLTRTTISRASRIGRITTPTTARSSTRTYSQRTASTGTTPTTKTDFYVVASNPRMTIKTIRTAPSISGGSSTTTITRPVTGLLWPPAGAWARR